ncbi:MAG: hypothetical protein MSA68_05945 [Helicobacter sp.]|nr:hypothetical protein [Helicobacter sp.]
MKSNKPSFTLFEMVLVLGLLGIFGAFSGQLLLGIYQNYAHERDNSNAQFRVQIALLQIKRILESAYLQSLQLSTNTASFFLSS